MYNIISSPVGKGLAPSENISIFFVPDLTKSYVDNIKIIHFQNLLRQTSNWRGKTDERNK